MKTEKYNLIILRLVDRVDKRTKLILQKIKKLDIDSLREANDRLEQENKELKEETLQWKQIKDMANNNKYRSALEEIREIADKCKECLNEDDDCGCDYLRIKRRIEEVLSNENN